MSKRIFITGATGFLGCHLVNYFLHQGDEVWALVRAKNGESTEERARQQIQQVSPLSADESARFHVIEGAVQDTPEQLVEAAAAQTSDPFDEIWHSAAIFNFKPRDKEKVEATNIQGTQNILDFAHLHHPEALPRFFYISTAYCLGRENNTAVPEHIPHNISDFRSIYEWSKHEAELRVEAAQKAYGLDAFVLRPSIIIGTPETSVTCHSGYYQVVNELERLRNTLEEKLDGHFDGNVHTRLLGDDRKLLNLVPIDFVVQGMGRLAQDERLLRSGLKVFNIVNEAPPSLGNVHEAVTNSLNIHGLRLVSQEALDAAEMNPIEKIINRRISFQAPYMYEDIHFTNECFRQYVSKEVLPPSEVDVAYLKQLNQQFLSKNGTDPYSG